MQKNFFPVSEKEAGQEKWIRFPSGIRLQKKITGSFPGEIRFLY